MGTMIVEHVTAGGTTIQVCHGDLTRETTEAIVNAANGHLSHGGGVAGAIVRRGGEQIQSESDRWVREHGPVPTGQAAVTGAGALACMSVIHAVGPVWNGGTDNEDELLRSAVINSLVKAEQLGLHSVALPAISSGIFGFPKARCARIMVAAACEFAETHPRSPLALIRFTNIDPPTVALFQAEVGALNARNA